MIFPRSWEELWRTARVWDGLPGPHTVSPKGTPLLFWCPQQYIGYDLTAPDLCCSFLVPQFCLDLAVKVALARVNALAES